MKTSNFIPKINFYLKIRPNLSYENLGNLLFIDNIYAENIEDLDEFRQFFVHFDPSIIDNSVEGVVFLRIVNSSESTDIIKERLNNYINIKFNCLNHPQNYEENMKVFKSKSIIVSQVIEDILEKSNYPDDIIKILQEKTVVKNCHDAYEMLLLYKKTKDVRIKFEILRKIGLIVLLSRIKKSFAFQSADFVFTKIKNVFYRGLGIEEKEEQNYYYWIDDNSKIVFYQDKKTADKMYNLDVTKRKNKFLPIYPIQTFTYSRLENKFNTPIIHIEPRNKFQKNDQVYYTSFVEKTIRKNLSFPNQVHDVIGIKIIVTSENEILDIISNIETFLGGSSTRKNEKNAFNKFGKKKLHKYSSEEFHVWKAIYDVSFYSFVNNEIEEIINIIANNTDLDEQTKKIIETKINCYKYNAQDFVIEVQLQDIGSYLFSKAHGSPTNHDTLKTNQIRLNSFYKLFPKEIYRKELISLKRKILKG